MKINEVMKKVLEQGTAALTAEEKKLMSEYVEPDVEREANAKAAAARKAAEKDAELLRQQLSDMQEQLEAAKNGGMTEAQKLQKEMDKLKNNLATSQKELAEAQQAAASALRDAGLDRVMTSIAGDLLPGVSKADVRDLIGLRLSGVDIADETSVKSQLDTVIKNNPALFRAKAAKGSGSLPYNAQAQTSKPVDRPFAFSKDIKADPKSARVELDSAWKNMTQGNQ
jgi:chromosome segregation ATPase